MTGNWEVLSNLSNEDIPAQIILGNDIKFSAKGTSSASFILDTGDSVYMENILYVPGLKKNLISVSALEDKGYTVGFSKGQVLVWEEDSTMDSAVAIGFREGGLYVFSGKSMQDSENNKEVQKGHAATNYSMREDLQKDLVEDVLSWKELTHDSGMIQEIEGVGIFCDSLMEDEENQAFS